MLTAARVAVLAGLLAAAALPGGAATLAKPQAFAGAVVGTTAGGGLGYGVLFRFTP